MDQCWYEVFDNKVRYDPSGKCSPEKDFQERNWMTFRQPERKRGGHVNNATSTDGMNTLAYLTLKVTLRLGRRNVSVILNSPSQDYTHPDNRTSPNYDITTGFTTFTIIR